MKILIVFSTTDGHTKKICLRLKRVMEEQFHHVTLQSVEEICDSSLNAFDKIIVGASIRYGKHARQIYRFIERNKKTLENKPNAFFSVNLVARKPEKNRPETNPYLKKFLKEISWKPENLAVFAGKIDYQKYHFTDRKMIQFIMWMTKGPTDPKAKIEFTNWNDVDAFALSLSDMAYKKLAKTDKYGT